MTTATLQKIGSDWGETGTFKPFTADYGGSSRTTMAHADYHDACLAARIFTAGISNTVLAAANAIATGVSATARPVIGVWNPPNSGKYLSILSASIATTTIAASAVSPGGFMWVGSSAYNIITTGSVPFCTSTNVQGGSVAKAFAVSTALTGLTGSLSVIRASSIGTINAAGPLTQIHQETSTTVENIDGSFIVPPGCVLALMNQVSTTTVNVSSGMRWEEVSIYS